MNRKKIIIISLVVAGTLVFVMFAFLKNKSASNNITTPAVSNNDSTNTFNTTTTSTSTNTGNTVDIKNAISKFIAAPVTQDISWAAIKDSGGNNMTLDEFSTAESVHIGQSVYNLLDPSKVDLIACPQTGTEKNIGIVLTLKALPHYNGDVYNDEVRYMKDWESTIFQDTKNVFFPDLYLTQQQLQAMTNFNNGTYRFAQASLQNNEKISINYDEIDAYIVISNSATCVDSAEGQLFGSDD